MPVSASGIPEKKASNMASPPADAPMPTMGKPLVFGVELFSIPVFVLIGLPIPEADRVLTPVCALKKN
jgi:hypothetical protein